MKKTICLFCCLLFFLPARRLWAQEIFVQGPAQFITRFSFTQLSGGVIVLRGCIDAYPDSLNFILDTGSGGISLDSSTVIELGIPTEPSERSIRGIAGVRKVHFANNHSLRLPGLKTDSLNFHINDYELLSGVYGLRVDGIIGFSFLRRYILKIDYDKLQIEVFTPGSIRYPKGGYLMRPSIAGLPMQYATLKESKSQAGRFFLDTGAGLCLLLSEDYCTDSSLFSPRKKRVNTVAQGVGGKKFMALTVLKEFRLGPYKFKKVPTYIFDDEFNVTAYPYLSGLIGNDLLRRFNTIINYSRSEFHLLPNTHFRSPFDYTYTGMSLYQEGEDIEIADVLDHSPAAKAGIKTGDILVGVGPNLTNNLQAYKNLLQAYPGRLKLIIRRNGELIQTIMEVKSIK